MAFALRTVSILAALAALATGQVLAEEFRIWTDASGQFKVEAQLVKVQDGKVELKKKDHSVISVAIEKLGAADQKYLRDRGGVMPAGAVNWKSDWGSFIAELNPYFKRGAPTAELKKAFEGASVTWVGEIEELSIKPDAASVKMKMPAKAVTLSDGSSTEVDYLHLSPKGENVKKWESLKADTSIRFRTTLQGNSIFPVVLLLQGVGENAGKTRVVISTKDAELLDAVSK